MKLVTSLTSPFARKVRVALIEKNIECELVVDIPWNIDTQVSQFNPLGKVPVLLRSNGNTVFDSRVIIEYLEQLKPWPLLIPMEASQMLAVKRWEALADGICDAAAAVFLERKRPLGQQSPEWIARQLGKVQSGLQAMNTELGEQSYCVNERFSLADIAVACCLGYLDFRFAEITWRAQFPALTRLADAMAQRPSFIATVPVV